MMTFVAKDADLAGLIAKLVSTRNNQMQKSFCGRYLQYKREYHSSMVDQVIDRLILLHKFYVRFYFTLMYQYLKS